MLTTHLRQLRSRAYVKSLNRPSSPRPAGTVQLGNSTNSARSAHITADNIVVCATNTSSAKPNDRLLSILSSQSQVMTALLQHIV